MTFKLRIKHGHIQYYAGLLYFILPQFPPEIQITNFLKLPNKMPQINIVIMYYNIFYRDSQLQV